MASAAPPPILPVNDAAGSGSTTGSAVAPPISASFLRLFLSRISDTARRSLTHRRPWWELLDRSAFARPDSLSDATSRLRKNLGYFRVNYLALLAAALAISLLSHPFSLLLLLALLAAWAFLYLFRPADAAPLVLFRRNFSDREILGGLVLLTLLVVFLTSIGSLIVSALMVGAAVVCVHGAFRVPEDLFLDDQDSTGPAGGFLSFLGGAAASSGTAFRI
ncbi:PRA1 family protein B2-like [Curcuma longa]|uniref:PRA1 family protein B2-like n=1 Tax=Curcuma longa TaxID=136217 RepID=UPI003D9ECD76